MTCRWESFQPADQPAAERVDDAVAGRCAVATVGVVADGGEHAVGDRDGGGGGAGRVAGVDPGRCAR